MEHVRLPDDCLGELPEVPYLCTEEYDEGRMAGFFGFSSYPDVKGWNRNELKCRRAWDDNYRCDDRHCHVHRCECQRPHSVQDNTSFLQTWLFFGLLQVFLGRRFHTSDFIRETDTSARVLTTARLPALITEWLADFNALNAQSRSATEDYIEYALTKAHEFYVYVCESSTVDPTVLLSIGLLGEALVGAARAHTALTVTEYDVWKHPTRLDINVITTYVTSRMLSSGWCPADIERLGWFDLTGIWYISNMSTIRGGPKHQECSRGHCKQLREYLRSGYSTKHVKPACDCESVHAPESQLTAILERRIVPLVTPTATNEQTTDFISITESRQGQKYVAISHVWADGLGNPGSNSIPACQHERLSKLVQDLYGEEDADVPYWIDTLACPVQPRESKILALGLIGKTYRDADKVLVLDSSLMALKHRSMDETEITMRIYLSAWMRRLWTYQEGIFAKSLYFQFADGVWDFDTAHTSIAFNALLGDRAGGALMLAFHYQQIRERKLQRPGHYLAKLPVAASAFRGRSTSDPADEAICLASLLDLDVERVARARTARDRMKAVWCSMTQFDRRLVFWGEDCLTEQGLRWAPSTFLESNEPLAGLPNEYTEEDLASKTPDGLLFQFPGLYLGRVTAELQSCLWLRDLESQSLEFPFFLMVHYPEALAPGTELALIMRTPITSSTRIWDPIPVVVVALTRVEDQVFYGTTLTIGLLSSRDGFSTQGVLNEANRVFRDLVRQTAISSYLNMMNGRLAGEEGVQKGLRDVDVSQILVDGKHGGFNLDFLPPTQKWCVERDVAWRHPLVDERQREVTGVVAGG